MISKRRECNPFKNRTDEFEHANRHCQPEVVAHTKTITRPFKLPTTKTKLLSFLGTCNDFCLFLPHFVHTAFSVTARPWQKQAKRLRQLSEEELIAMQTLQVMFITPAIPPFQRKEGQYPRKTSAKHRQTKYLLLQKQCDSVYRPIVHWFKIFENSKPKLDIKHREFFSFVWKIFLLCPHLNGARSTVLPDQKALK